MVIDFKEMGIAVMRQISSIFKNFLYQLPRDQFFIGLIGLMSFQAQAGNKVTISGISSGGFMASQMATAFSSQISGVGTVAGGFFYCAQNHLQEKISEGKNNLLGTRNLFLFEASPKFYADIITGQAAFYPQGGNQWVQPSVKNPTYAAVSICMHNPSVAKLPTLHDFEEKGLIDPVENLKSQQVYVYQGHADTVVNPKMANHLVDFYTENKVGPQNIKLKTLPGGHNFPTDKAGLNDCKNQSMPYVSSCEFNLAQDMLEHLLQVNLSRSEARLENLHRVDQNPIPINETRSPKDWISPAASLAAYGYLYASPFCLAHPSSCQMHVALHGCEMSDSFDRELDERYQKQVSQSQVVYLQNSSQDVPFWATDRPSNQDRKLSYGTLKFAVLSGYIEMAEKNNLMILFPQTWISSQNYPYNPKGCWDWFGVNGPDYATKNGVETSWLMKFIQNIQANPTKHILSTKPDFEKIHN